jgi:hypothetical protein
MQRVCLRAGKIVVIVGVFFVVALSPSHADPLGDFFKRLGNSIAHPGQKPPPKKTGKKNGGKAIAGKSPAPLTSPSPGETTTLAPPQSTPPTQAPTPTPVTVRAAGGLKNPTRRDMPYGVPVPGRPGFVTSPYAPTVGLVDVRGFPSGTEVKDPYTGKLFLTP